MLISGDCLEKLRSLPSASVQTCVTSPPYWGLRDYGVDGQLGLEKTPEEYVSHMVEVFREVRRVLRADGTLWLNLGDSYNGTGTGQKGNGLGMSGKRWDEIKSGARGKDVKGLKPKDLVGIPWRVAFALQADGWYLRQDIIWAKPNPMPESVRDRCTKAHEYIFLLSKSPKYFFDHEALKEPCVSPVRNREKFNGESAVDTKIRGFGSHCGTGDLRNRRSVWNVTTKPFKGAHFATFPVDLIEPCVLAGAPKDGVVLDPFAGAGTVGVACKKHGREFLGIELNPEYLEIATQRIANA